MRVLFFDCYSGISGNMILGALLDLGISEDVFRRELGKLNLPGYGLIIRKVQKDGIWGTDVTVVTQYGEKHMEEHGVELEKRQECSNCRTYCYDWHSSSTCCILDIERLINGSGFRPGIKDFSIRAFREIARAEAKVRGISMEDVSFHAAEAVDSIVHIVGTRICIDLLGINRVFSSPLCDGKGLVKYCNGMLSIPSPVVAEMISGSGIPLITMDINMELVTPTGMSLIKCMASDFGNMPAMIINRVGYGMGKRETGMPDVLRVVQGDLLEGKIIEGEYRADEILPLEIIDIVDGFPEIPAYKNLVKSPGL